MNWGSHCGKRQIYTWGWYVQRMLLDLNSWYQYEVIIFKVIQIQILLFINYKEKLYRSKYYYSLITKKRGAFQMAQRVKCLPAVQETQVWSLGREDPLQKEMASHSSTLAWRTPWTEEPGGLQPMGSQEVDAT